MKLDGVDEALSSLFCGKNRSPLLIFGLGGTGKVCGYCRHQETRTKLVLQSTIGNLAAQFAKKLNFQTVVRAAPTHMSGTSIPSLT